MATLEEREKRLGQRIRRRLNVEYSPYILGDEDGRINHPTLPGYVFVRKQTSNGLSKAFPVLGPAGAKVPLKPGPVQLGRDAKNRLRVTGTDPDGWLNAGVDPVALQQQQDSQRVKQDNIETLWMFASLPASTTINVKAWPHIANGVVKIFYGASLDLGASGANVIPSTGYQAWVMIFVKDDFATLEAKSSSLVPLNEPLDLETALQECVDAASPGSTEVWALLLGDGQTTVEQTDIDAGIDFRNIISRSESASGGGSLDKVLMSDLGFPLVTDNGFFLTRA